MESKEQNQQSVEAPADTLNGQDAFIADYKRIANQSVTALTLARPSIAVFIRPQDKEIKAWQINDRYTDLILGYIGSDHVFYRYNTRAHTWESLTITRCLEHARKNEPDYFASATVERMLPDVYELFTLCQNYVTRVTSSEEEEEEEEAD